MAMAGDDILMDSGSAVGPIDAQLFWQGKRFSADALLEGLEKIKSEVEKTGSLNRAYIPILQGISPGELQDAENALNFAKVLVTEWLAKYKFQNWNTHSSTGDPVTEADKRLRANEIADQLCDHRKWLTHGRSLKIEDLEGMRLRITNFGADPELADAIRRYHTLLQMAFQTNIYKVVETPTSAIYRFSSPPAPEPTPPTGAPLAKSAQIQATCPTCGTVSQLQADFEKGAPLADGFTPFPSDNVLKCPGCSAELNLTDLRRQLEAQAKRSILGGV
jgi:hypothetical protein